MTKFALFPMSPLVPIDAVSDVASTKPSLRRGSDTLQPPLGDSSEDPITRAAPCHRRGIG